MTTTNSNITERSRLNNILHISLLEILGETQTQEFLGQNYEIPVSPSTLHNSLVNTFGALSSSGIEHRIGQAFFRHFIKWMGSDLGFFQSSYKLLPVKNKIIIGFKILSDLYARIFEDKLRIAEDESGYQLQVGNEFPPSDRITYYGCNFIIGFLKEFMSWMGNGKVYAVNEKECRIKGSAFCIFIIGKVPLE